MSTLDIFIEKGKAEGKAEGIAEGIAEACRNLIKLGADNEFICQALEVDEAYVKRVRGELRQGESGEGEA